MATFTTTFLAFKKVVEIKSVGGTEVMDFVEHDLDLNGPSENHIRIKQTAIGHLLIYIKNNIMLFSTMIDPHSLEPLLELETDKVTVEVPAPDSGVLTEIVAAAGIEVAVGETLGRLDICATDNLIAADETTSPACAA